MKHLLLLAAAISLSLQMNAQTVSNPLSTGAKGVFASLKNNVLKAAEEMPESDYSYKPVETVRTFGQLIGHIADSQYEFCTPVITGESGKDPGNEKSKTTKSDLIAALKTAFSYCDQGYDSMTDAKASDMVKFFGRDMAKLTILNFNSTHTGEHYGNIVTYLRMKGLVPPSSKH
jgi:uncharacterized damage-inducible protein DinB